MARGPSRKKKGNAKKKKPPQKAPKQSFFSKLGKLAVRESRYKPLKGMSRREFLARSVLGASGLAISVAGARKTAARIPYWTGARHSYNLGIQFGRHFTASDFRKIAEKIERARAEGKPLAWARVNSKNSRKESRE